MTHITGVVLVYRQGVLPAVAGACPKSRMTGQSHPIGFKTAENQSVSAPNKYGFEKRGADHANMAQR